MAHRLERVEKWLMRPATVDEMACAAILHIGDPFYTHTMSIPAVRRDCDCSSLNEGVWVLHAHFFLRDFAWLFLAR